MQSPPHLNGHTGSMLAAHIGTTAATWHVRPAESWARFTATTMWGRATVLGQFGEVTGHVTWEGDDTAGRGRLAVDVTALSTGIRLRDRHLRGDDFFAVQAQRAVTYQVDRAVREGDELRLDGQILIRGARHALSCRGTVVPASPDRVAVDATATFDLETLGMSRGLFGMIAPTVQAEVRATLQRAAD